MARAWMLFVLVLAVGCGGSGSTNPGTDGSGGGSDADVPDGPPPPPGFTSLINRSWSIPPGATNIYKCVRIKTTEDMWIAGFHADSPPGSHHSVVTISTTSQQTGEYDCSAGTLDNQMLYAAGVGTDDLLFPTGVAMHIPVGTFINLNLHLFNATDNPLSGTSGVSVKTVAAAEVQNEADMMFSGNINFTIQNTGQPVQVTGGCMAPTDWHIFTLWPHMHQIATHQQWSFTHNGTKTTLLDDDYTFEEQRNYPIAETLVRKGDEIQTVCTYINNTNGPIGFGDGSDKEMCFTGMYKYPAGGNLLQCALGF
jgi:hypothetical protein